MSSFVSASKRWVYILLTRTTILVLLFTQTSRIISAQPLQISISPPSTCTNPSGLILGKVISYDKEKYLVLAFNNNKKPALCYYSKDLNLLSNHKLSFKNKESLDHKILNVYNLEGKIIGITSCFNVALKSYQINAWQFSEKGEIQKGPVELLRTATNQYLIRNDLQNQRIYVFNTAKNLYGQTLSGYQVQIYDSELSLELRKTFFVPVNNQSISIKDVIVPNNETSWLSIKLEDIPKPNSKIGLVKNYSSILLKQNFKNNDNQAINLALEEVPFIHNIGLFFSEDSKSLVTISANSSTSSSGISKIVATKFPFSDTVASYAQSIDIPTTFQKSSENNNRKFVDTNSPKRKLKGVMDLNFKFHEEENHKFIISASIERSNIELGTSPLNDPLNIDRFYQTWYLQNALVINASWKQPEVSIYEILIDQKFRQQSGVPGAYGINLFPHHEYNFLLYNDLSSNLNSKFLDQKNLLQYTELNKKIAQANLLYIDTTGRKINHIIFSNPKDQALIGPTTKFVQSPYCHVYLACDSRNNLRLVRITK